MRESLNEEFKMIENEDGSLEKVSIEIRSRDEIEWGE
jgi:hypothetical protein